MRRTFVSAVLILIAAVVVLSALLGAVGTPILSKVSETAALGPLLGALTPAIGLSGFALPVFLGLTAWGVLGKMEKWSQGTAPRPRA